MRTINRKGAYNATYNVSLKRVKLNSIAPIYIHLIKLKKRLKEIVSAYSLVVEN